MKKEDFIVGKWYKSSLWSCFKAAKFMEFEDGRFKYSEALYKGNDKLKSDSGYTGTDSQKWSSFSEVPISEIIQFLPDGHPDKNYSPNYEIY